MHPLAPTRSTRTNESALLELRLESTVGRHDEVHERVKQQDTPQDYPCTCTTRKEKKSNMFLPNLTHLYTELQVRLPSAASGHACLVCWRGHIPAEAPQKADRRPADNPFDGFIVARAVRTCGSRETHKKRANRGITKRGTRNLGAVGRRKQGGKPKAHNLGAFWVETDHGSARGHDRHVGEPKHQDKRDEETPGIPDPIRPAAKSMRVRVRVCLWGCVRVGCARTNVPHAVLYMFEVHLDTECPDALFRNR